MNQNVQLVTIQVNCDEATAQAVQLLSSVGLQAVRSFDLRSARMAHAECTCQFVVLLVYEQGSAPMSLVVHGHDGKTWLSLVDTPQQPADMKLVTKIAQALSPENFVLVPHDQLVVDERS